MENTMPNEAYYTVSRMSQGGKCSRCGEYSDILLNCSVFSGQKSKSYILCKNCSKSFNATALINNIRYVPSQNYRTAEPEPASPISSAPQPTGYYQAQPGFSSPVVSAPTAVSQMSAGYSNVQHSGIAPNHTSKPPSGIVSAFSRFSDRLPLIIVLIPYILSLALTILHNVIEIVVSFLRGSMSFPSFIETYYGYFRLNAYGCISLIITLFSIALSCVFIWALVDGSLLKIATVKSLSVVIWLAGGINKYPQIPKMFDYSNFFHYFFSAYGIYILCLMFFISFILLLHSERTSNSAFGRFIGKYWFVLIAVLLVVECLMLCTLLIVYIKRDSFNYYPIRYTRQIIDWLLHIANIVFTPAYIVRLSRTQKQNRMNGKLRMNAEEHYASL